MAEQVNVRASCAGGHEFKSYVATTASILTQVAMLPYWRYVAK